MSDTPEISGRPRDPARQQQPKDTGESPGWSATEPHLVAIARSGQRLPNVVVALVVIVVVFTVGGAMGFAVITSLAVPLDGLADETFASTVTPLRGAIYQAIRLVVAFGFPLLLLTLWVQFYEQRPLRTLGFDTGWGLAKFARGFVIGAVMLVAVVAVLAPFGYIGIEDGNPDRQGLIVVAPVLLVALGWVVQASVEEIAVRGWLMPAIAARYNNVWLGVALSSLVFALLHILNPGIGPVAIANLVLVSVFLSVFALWERGIWGVCGIHTAWNWAQGNVFGFEVSGTDTPGGVLVNLEESGPGLLTGDAFGPEAGVVVTGVLVAALVVSWVLLVRSGRHRSGEVPQ